jgi:hypothetical protein
MRRTVVWAFLPHRLDNRRSAAPAFRSIPFGLSSGNLMKRHGWPVQTCNKRHRTLPLSPAACWRSLAKWLAESSLGTVEWTKTCRIRLICARFRRIRYFNAVIRGVLMAPVFERQELQIPAASIKKYLPPAHLNTSISLLIRFSIMDEGFAALRPGRTCMSPGL